MDKLNLEILDEFSQLIHQKLPPSQVMRRIFMKFGEISPPEMAQYFKAVYALPSMEFMAALGAWWHDSSSDITDEEFDRRIQKVLAQLA